MNRCLLVERGYMYDAYLDGKFVGKGQAHYIGTAYYFYTQEGFNVEIIQQKTAAK